MGQQSYLYVLIALLLPWSVASAESLRTTFNPFTGKFDFVTDVSTGSLSLSTAAITSGKFGDDRVAVSTCAEFYGASASASAATNTSAIQSALNVGGYVALNTPGTYQINDTLVIGSSTTFRLAPGVVIKQASGTNKSMIVNSNYNTRATSTTVTVAWSLNNVATVTWTAHALSTGDYVWIGGAMPSYYDGIFKVSSVLGANSFTYTTMRLPTASATGLIKAKKADVNITVDGGMWDYDQANNSGAGGTLNAMLSHFGGVQNLQIKNFGCMNALKYCLDIGAVRDVVVENTTAPSTASDIVKIVGPAFNSRIVNTSGKAGDDGVSLQSEIESAFAYTRWTWGDIINAVIDGTDIEQMGGQSVVAVYVSSAQYSGGIAVRNIGGTSVLTDAVAIVAQTASARLNDILVENVSAQVNSGFLLSANGYDLTVTTLTIKNYSYNPSISGGARYSTSGTVSVTNMEIQGSDMATSFAGNVGIGTTAPTTQLQVGTASLAVTAAGNVGIGTTAPAYALDMTLNNPIMNFTATTNSRSIQFIPGSGSLDSINTAFNMNRYAANPVSIGFNAAAHLRVGQASGEGVFGNTALIYAANTETGTPGLVIDRSSGQTSDVFQVRSSTSSGANLMVMSSGGNVGIGTTNPGAILDAVSTTSGMGVPAMTTAQIDAVAGTPSRAGIIVYNSTLPAVCVSTGNGRGGYAKILTALTTECR